MTKSAFYHTPCIRRPRYGGFRRNIGTPFGTEKLERCRYPMVKKIRRYMFIRFDVIDERDRQTDGRTDGQTDRQTDGPCMTA